MGIRKRTSDSKSEIKSSQSSNDNLNVSTNDNNIDHQKSHKSSIDNSHEKKKEHKKELKSKKIFGIDVTNYNPTLVLLAFSTCHIFFSVVYAYYQEKVQLIPGFKYPKFMTLVQTVTYTICAFVEMLSARGELGYVTRPQAPIRHYFGLSILTFAGMYFTNWGLEYLSYPTRIIFKSAKPVPTMILEAFYVGMHFSKFEVLEVLILTVGITMFCLGESRGAPSFDSKGIILMILGVIFDSLTSTYEKKNIFSCGTSHAEAMFFASLLGSIWSIGTLLMTEFQQTLEAISFCFHKTDALLWLFLSSIGGYLSVVFVLLLIKIYAATYAECVKGLRKVFSIGVSYLFIGDNKVFSELHAIGISFFILSSGVTISEKYLVDNNKESKKKK